MFVLSGTVSEVFKEVRTLKDSAHRVRELFLLLYSPWKVKYTCMCQMPVFASILINTVI